MRPEKQQEYADCIKRILTDYLSSDIPLIERDHIADTRIRGVMSDIYGEGFVDGIQHEKMVHRVVDKMDRKEPA